MTSVARTWLLFPVILLSLAAGCGSVDTPYEEPGITRRGTEASADASAVASPSGEPAGPAGSNQPPSDDDKAQRIAEKLLQGQIGWVPSKKAFAVITTFTQEGTGIGVLASVANETDAYAAQQVICEAGDGCDGDSQGLLASAKAWVEKEKLHETAMLELAELRPSAGQPMADIGALGGRVVWKKDHFDVVRGTKATPLARAVFPKEFTVTPAQATASPDGSLLIALFHMDPGSNYAKGFNVHVDVKVFKVP